MYEVSIIKKKIAKEAYDNLKDYRLPQENTRLESKICIYFCF